MYQNELAALLERHFTHVVKEWSVSRNVVDLLAPSKEIYAARIDVAVGPFNLEIGNLRCEIAAMSADQSPPHLAGALASLVGNPNPR